MLIPSFVRHYFVFSKKTPLTNAVESSLRVHLDDHATFMIHMPLLEFARLCNQLRVDNEAWAERAKHDPSAERIFGVCSSFLSMIPR